VPELEAIEINGEMSPRPDWKDGEVGVITTTAPMGAGWRVRPGAVSR
jgi:hypothetical protein